MPWRSDWRSRSWPLWGSGPYWGSGLHWRSWVSWCHWRSGLHWRSGSVPWRSALRSRSGPLWWSWFHWGSGPYWGSGLFRGSRSYWWSLSWSRLIPMPFHFSPRLVQDFSSQNEWSVYEIKFAFWFFDVFIKFRFFKKATKFDFV